MKTTKVAIYYSDSTNSFEGSYLLEIEVDPNIPLADQISTIHTAVAAVITDDTFRGYKIVDEDIDFSFGRQLWFKLDDTSGNAIDSQGGNDLSPNGAPIYQKPGLINTCIQFSAGNTLSASSTSPFQVRDNKEFVYSIWYYVTAAANVLLGKVEGVGNSHTIFTVDDGSGNPKPKVSANGVNVDSGTSTHKNAWNHLLVCIDVINSKIRIYVNGTLAVTNSSAQVTTPDSGDFFLGSDGHGNDMTGYLDQVQRWAFDTALDDYIRNKMAVDLYNNGVGLDG